MKLPKIEHPIHEVKITSKKDPVRIRPFLVKEQKILMMAVESGEIEEVVKSIKQVVVNCCLEDIDVESLPLIDLELLFLNLRARSVGENIDLYFKCKNQIEPDVECGMVIDISVDILKDVVANIPEINDIIMVTDKVGLKMKFPTFSVFAIDMNNVDEDYLLEDVICECIDTIFDEEEVYNGASIPKEEKLEFISQLQTEQYARIEEFLRNTPTITYEGDHVCPKCSFQHKVRLEGLQDFFI
jgi:hypothetical protein